MLHIVATQVKHGRGGISTALVGFTESPQLQAHGFNIIESHGSGGRWQAFLRAVRQIHADVKPGDIVWLHCGPWLSMLRKGYLARVAKQHGAIVYIHLHSQRTQDLLITSWGRCLVRWLLKPANKVVVLTPWWAQLLQEKLPDLTTRINVVPNPLDASFEALAKKPPRSSLRSSIRLLTMTRLVPGKGVEAVIRLMPLLPKHFRLVIAGEGPLRGEFEKLAVDSGCEDRIEFVGWVQYENKITLLENTDIFCLPSTNDSFGMGFIEAMAAGLPVVAFALDAIKTVVVNGKTGVLVTESNPETLHDAIQTCIKDYAMMSAAAKTHVLDSFTTKKAVEQLFYPEGIE